MEGCLKEGIEHVFSAYSFVVFCAGAALAFGGILAYFVLSQKTGSEAMQKIARAIQDGASAYLNRQYQMIALVGALAFFLLTWHSAFL